MAPSVIKTWATGEDMLSRTLISTKLSKSQLQSGGGEPAGPSPPEGDKCMGAPVAPTPSIGWSATLRATRPGKLNDSFTELEAFTNELPDS